VLSTLKAKIHVNEIDASNGEKQTLKLHSNGGQASLLRVFFIVVIWVF